MHDPTKTTASGDSGSESADGRHVTLRRRFLKTTAGVSLAGLAGCASGISGGGGGPFTIGINIELSKGFGLVGGGMVNAAKLAGQEINDAGGLAGREIEFVVEDNQVSPDTAISKTKKLIQQDNVDMLFGPISSFIRVAISPVARENETPLLYPISYEGIKAKDYCNRYLFKAWLVPHQQAIPLVPWLMDEYDVNSFYMLGSDYTWPRSLNEVVRSAVNDNGGKVVGESYVQLGTTDFSSILPKIEQKNPDALIMDVVGASVPSIQKQMANRGLREKWLEVGLGHAPDVITGVPVDAVKGVLMNRGYFKAINSEKNQQFIQKYQKTYDDKTIVSPTTGPAYIAMNLLANGVEQAGGTSAEELMNGLPQASIDSIAGPVSFEHDHQVKSGSYVAKINEQKEGEIIKSFDAVMPPEQCSEF